MSRACIDVRAFVETECSRREVIDCTRLSLEALEVLPKYQLDDVREHVLMEVARIRASHIEPITKH